MLYALLLACTGADTEENLDLGGVPVLGSESNSLEGLSVQVMATSEQGLDRPRDLDFNPEHPGELWIVNQDDDSTTVLFDAGTDAQTSRHDVDPYAQHFMEEVSGIAFGAPGTFATSQESRNTYNDRADGNDFMGPALWSSDFEVYAVTNEQAVQYVGFDLGSHLDMLHESPLCTGIAWERDNAYWVFDGYNATLARYDFQLDHGPGYDDHSDGVIAKYVSGEIGYVEGVSSHLVMDTAANLLYVADTGNNRIAVLDTTSGTRGQDLRSAERGVDHYEVDGASLVTLINGADFGMGQPSGLALVNGLLYVSDYGTGNLFAFELDGTLVDWAPTGHPGIMGITAVDDYELWFVDADTDEVVRILAQ